MCASRNVQAELSTSGVPDSELARTDTQSRIDGVQKDQLFLFDIRHMTPTSESSQIDQLAWTTAHQMYREEAESSDWYDEEAINIVFR